MEYQSLLIASFGFLIIHFVSATNLRVGIVKKWGMNAWMGLFSLVSLTFFCWMVYSYMIADTSAKLWVMPLWWLWVNALLMFMALFFVIMGNVPDKNARLGKGIFSITRHPSNWGIAIFCIAHLVSNGSVAGLVFWGSIAGVGIFGSYFLDKRKTTTGGEERWVNSLKNSSWLPFWALVKGKTEISFDDFKPSAVMISVAVFFVAAIVHVAVFKTYILPL